MHAVMLPRAFRQFESSFEKSYPMVNGRAQTICKDVLVAIVVGATVVDLVVAVDTSIGVAVVVNGTAVVIAGVVVDILALVVLDGLPVVVVEAFVVTAVVAIAMVVVVIGIKLFVTLRLLKFCNALGAPAVSVRN